MGIARSAIFRRYNLHHKAIVIIQTNHIPDGFDAITVWPFIFMRPSEAADVALVAHEMVHYVEQRNCGVLPWLLRYMVSKKFRLAAEVRGYQKQIKIGGISVEAAASYLTQYRTGISQAEAIKMLIS